MQTTENKSLVSVIIPCRNEDDYIAQCLDSVLTQDYAQEKLDILVVDGMSEDKTREMVGQYQMRYPCVRLLDNPRKITPCALNLGVKSARGAIIVRMDAHAVYPNDYISKCVHYLKKYGADNVGGIWITLPGKNTKMAKSIAWALASPFGVGNAYFRIGSKKPRYVDTVPFGCYKKEVFEKIGLFDEDLIRNQDGEFNLRLINSGGKILLAPEIVSYYYARDSFLKLGRMYFQYGYFKSLVVKKTGRIISWRQIIPALFICSLLVAGLISFFSKYAWLIFCLILELYLAATFAFSITISVKKKDLRFLPFLMVSFATMHFNYGFAYLKGIFDFMVMKKHLKKKIEDLPLTR